MNYLTELYGQSRVTIYCIAYHLVYYRLGGGALGCKKCYHARTKKTRKKGSFERPSHGTCVPCLGYEIWPFWPKRVSKMKGKTLLSNPKVEFRKLDK